MNKTSPRPKFDFDIYKRGGGEGEGVAMKRAGTLYIYSII